jgi:hypothetical protein
MQKLFAVLALLFLDLKVLFVFLVSLSIFLNVRKARLPT